MIDENDRKIGIITLRIIYVFIIVDKTVYYKIIRKRKEWILGIFRHIKIRRC